MVKSCASADSGRGPRPEPVVFEALEPRVLLSATCPQIIDVFADNRGFITLQADRDLNGDTISNSSVQLFTAGNDGLLGTADDQLVIRTVRYSGDDRTIQIQSSLEADTPYRVRLNGSVIRGTNGMLLDGEFNGADVASGDGVQGGDYEFFTRRAVVPIARFSTISGLIDVELFDNQTPLTVANFLAYANDGDWDNTFFHRLIENFVLQGGGFEATNGFPEVPDRPPVQNEPGISNLFGTIAMAKLDGQPNSATNQWFFNLRDNSNNLDGQNGGFTVFGQIVGASSFATLARLANFSTVDASGQNGAFGDLPVQDPDAVDDNGGVARPADVLTVSRIAILMDITGEPFQQLDEENSITFVNNAGDVTVRVYALDGLPADALEPFIRVNFGENRSVNAVTLLNGMPDRRFGVQIEGATVLQRFADQRRDDRGDLAFIVTDSRIEVINLRYGISGENLNGFVLPGLRFDADIDGDNLVSDLTAIFVPEGNSNLLSVGGDLSGDALFLGGLNRVTVRGEVNNSDIRLGAGNLNRLIANFRNVIDTRLVTEAPISLVKASEWSVLDQLRGLISAPSLQKLRVTGDNGQGLDGNFNADIELSGDDNIRTLANANIRGGVLSSNWDITGDIGNVIVRGTSSGWELDVTGDAGVFRLDRLFDTTIGVTGTARTLRAVEWIGGGLSALEMRSVLITGRNSDNLDGDFSADFSVGGQTTALALRQFRVNGDAFDFSWFANGDVRSFIVRGGLSDASIFANDNLDTIMVGAIRDSDINVQLINRSLRFTDWIGGQLLGFNYLSITATGDQRNGIEGNFFADVIVSRVESFTLENAGSFIGLFDANFVLNFRATGEVRDSLFTFSSQPQTRPTIGQFHVTGQILDTIIRSSGNVDSISAAAMINSGLYVAVAGNTNGLPDSNPGANPAGFLGSIVIGSLGSGQFQFVNSYVVAPRIDSALIFYPDPANLGQPHGLAAGSIGFVDTRILGGGRQRATNPGMTLEPIGDYQVRVNFAPPA